jgi:hypothetical protein
VLLRLLDEAKAAISADHANGEGRKPVPGVLGMGR